MRTRLVLMRSLALLFWASPVLAQGATAPAPLLKAGKPVDWWFVFKLNTKIAPQCGGPAPVCLFGGKPQTYKFGLQFAVASSAAPTLTAGSGCAGSTVDDPLGATFDQVYHGKLFYVIWNDQFYADPMPTKASPWGHSKGMLAWNKEGDGFVLQVSTPSWPAAGSSAHPRKTDGNTLGCVSDDDVLVSQHFFALRLPKSDLVTVLKALVNASIVTDPTDQQVVHNGGPAEIKKLVKDLGKKVSKANTSTADKLSTGVILISKPSHLQVPPWQLVSAKLEGQPSLRAATWWAHPEIPTTTASTPVGCWDPGLPKPGAVEIATTGIWNGRPIGLEGIGKPDGNHAKIGVSTSGRPVAIFGDLNQQGALNEPNCKSSQNGRGGLFYVVDNADLARSVADLIRGETGER